MKLNYKRTLLIGLAFLSISAFWQMYDNIIPLILKNTFHMKETMTGVIMAGDNVLALFLLPIFGALSDKVDTKIGKRMPFILIGTALACTLLVILPIADNTVNMALFVGGLFFVLISMGTYRSPAVALMPDLTPKPLRSKANAIINLMGTGGGILVLVLGMVFSTSAVQNAMMSYTVYYAIIAAIMLGALTIFLCTVREPKWAAEMAADSVKYGIEENAAASSEHRSLSASEKKSLICILLSIALWYFGYNAVTSKYAVYAGNILDKDYNTTMLLAQAAAIVAYLPAGTIASKIGRKKTILAGVVMLTTAFGCAAFMRASSPTLVMNILFALAGVAWATINVNSFPMVVEMCSGADIGKYTGFYYTASMTAQIVTPMLSGFLMDKMGMTVLFPYAAIFVALAFGTMFMVRHGDAKVTAKKGLEAFADED